jgi:hypothetical protein
VPASSSTGGARGSLLWSVAGGVVWTMAVVSDLIYIGLLPIVAYCAIEQALSLRRLGLSRVRAAVAPGLWNLLLPLAYFAAVGYPGTKANSAYATTGVRFIRENLHYYRTNLAPTTTLAAVYVLALALALMGGVVAARRRDWFPLAVLAAAGGVAFPALVQGQQRAVHYLAMPLLLTFSAVAAGVRPVLSAGAATATWIRRVWGLAVIVALLLLFRQGADIRAFFVQSPYGDSLAAFRSQVAALTPAGARLCVRLDLDAQDQALFSAEMSGPHGFLIAPIAAAGADIVAGAQACPKGATSTAITVRPDGRGGFSAGA